jgi:replicative DNA helicase
MSAPVPYDNESEATIIGSLILSPEWADDVPDISMRWFYTPICARLWDGLINIRARGALPTGAELLAELSGWEPLPEWRENILDWHQWAAESRTDFLNAVRLVRDAFLRREMIRLAGDMRAKAFGTGEGYVQPASVLDALDAQLDALRGGMGASGEMHDFSGAGIEALDGLKTLAAHRVATGFEAVDNYLGGGLSPGQNTILAAATSVGKSAFAICTALNAVRNGVTVGYFALEMPRHEIAMRGGCFLDYDKSRQHNLRYNDVSNGVEDAAAAIRLRRVFEDETYKRLFIDDRGGLRVSQMSEQLRAWESMARRRGVDRPRLVVVDNLGNITAERAGERTDEAGRVSKALLAFAKRHNVAVLTLHHLNRDSIKDERMPKLHDLRQSGEIEQDANAVLFIYREAHFARQAMDAAKDQKEYNLASERWMRTKNAADIIIAKNRNGPLGKVPLACDIASNAFWTPFSNVTPIWEQAG